MSEEDYKGIIASYQQRSFDLFNANIMLETQIVQLKKQIEELKKKVHNDYIDNKNGGNPIPENGSDDF